MKKRDIFIIFSIVIFMIIFILYYHSLKKQKQTPITSTQLPKLKVVKMDFNLNSVLNYNFFNYNPTNINYKNRNVFIIADVFESSFKNINEMIPLTKAIVHIIPIFNNSKESEIKMLYCNDVNNSGKNLYYYLKYNINYSNSIKCDFSKILNQNKIFKENYNLKNLPMIIFDSGDQTKLNISESNALSKTNLFNEFLEISKPIQKTIEETNTIESTSLHKKTENGISTKIKSNKFTNKGKKYILIGESYPDLYRVSLFTKKTIKELKDVNNIKNENIVLKGSKIYY